MWAELSNSFQEVEDSVKQFSALTEELQDFPTKVERPRNK